MMFGSQPDDAETPEDAPDLDDLDLPTIPDEGQDVGEEDVEIEFEAVPPEAGWSEDGGEAPEEVEGLVDPGRADEVVERFTGRIEELQHDLATVLREEVEGLQEEFGEAVTAMHTLLQGSREAQKAAVDELEQAREELEAREASTRELRSEVAELRQELEARKARVDELEGELASREGSVEELETELAQARSKLLNINEILGEAAGGARVGDAGDDVWAPGSPSGDPAVAQAGDGDDVLQGLGTLEEEE